MPLDVENNDSIARRIRFEIFDRYKTFLDYCFHRRVEIL